MSGADVIRAWKDEAYRSGLSVAQIAALPGHPSGTIELSELELEPAAGGSTEYYMTLGCCAGYTQDSCACTHYCTGPLFPPPGP